MLYAALDPAGHVEAARRLDQMGMAAEPGRLLIEDLRGELTDPAWWRDKAREYGDREVSVFMLDNILATLPPGAEVNNAGDVRGLLDGLRELLDTGITVVAVHHPAKGGPNGPARSPLGSRAIEAHFRSLLRLEKGRSGHVLHVNGNETPELQLPLQLRESEGMRFALAADEGSKEPAGTGRRNRRAQSYDRNLELARAILQSGQTTKKSATGRFLYERGDVGTDESGRSKVYDLLRAGLLAEENGRLIAGPSLSGPPAVL